MNRKRLSLQDVLLTLAVFGMVSILTGNLVIGFVAAVVLKKLLLKHS